MVFSEHWGRLDAFSDRLLEPQLRQRFADYIAVWRCGQFVRPNHVDRFRVDEFWPRALTTGHFGNFP